MQWRTVRNIAEMILPYAAILFLFAAAFGMMHIGAHGHMHQCLFMGMLAVCDMSPLQHINAWQQMYTAILLQMALAAILSAILARLEISALFKPKFIPPKTVPAACRRREVEHFTFLNSILDALSNGTLHSKAF